MYNNLNLIKTLMAIAKKKFKAIAVVLNRPVVKRKRY